MLNFWFEFGTVTVKFIYKLLDYATLPKGFKKHRTPTKINKLASNYGVYS